MTWGRIAIIGIVAVAAVAGLWWAFTPRPLSVETATVGTGDLVITVEDEGLARMRNVARLSMPVGGELLRLPVKVGDQVAAGEVVASILPVESALLDPVSRAEATSAVGAAEEAVLAAQSEYNMAESELAYWRGEAARKESLLEKGVTTAQALQQVQLELTRREALQVSARAALAMRKHQLEQAEARLASNGTKVQLASRRDVMAPMAGQVLSIANENGRSLPAGTPLMEIGEPGALEVVVDLLSADAVRIKEGAMAAISGWGGGGAGRQGGSHRADRLHQGVGARCRGTAGAGAPATDRAAVEPRGTWASLPGVRSDRGGAHDRCHAAPGGGAVPGQQRVERVRAGRGQGGAAPGYDWRADRAVG
ncbi:MAG: HlyD family efflux transporter periplasmic adaptor subunit [Devosia sp.]|nr:HlyD family efflux transporter periplasmic adaptor subunit [Devosia sp.]